MHMTSSSDGQVKDVMEVTGPQVDFQKGKLIPSP